MEWMLSGTPSPTWPTSSCNQSKDLFVHCKLFKHVEIFQRTCFCCGTGFKLILVSKHVRLLVLFFTRFSERTTQFDICCFQFIFYRFFRYLLCTGQHRLINHNFHLYTVHLYWTEAGEQTVTRHNTFTV